MPSDSLTILHAIPPAQPDSPSTQNSGQDVIISWTAPNNHGSAISSYQILIKESDGITFTADLASCDGSDALIVQ